MSLHKPFVKEAYAKAMYAKLFPILTVKWFPNDHA